MPRRTITTRAVRYSLAALTLAATLAGCATRRNPYPDGILPVGDGMYVTDAPRKGYLYACEQFADSLDHNAIGGARVRGAWFTEDGLGWRPADKPHVQGDVAVAGRFNMAVRGQRRIIVTNGLPAEHTIGHFPVPTDDPAHRIDPNPNTAAAYNALYTLPAEPPGAQSASCVGHQVGVMTRGAALFSPLDAQGRDAVAWEVQDHCDGHPEPNGTYHYHGPSPCLPGTDTDAVIGFALDGFPITGSGAASGHEVFSADLDECHGGVADVDLDGKRQRTYRYAMTRDYPYTVACFHGVPTQPQIAHLPGSGALPPLPQPPSASQPPALPHG